MSWYKGKTDTVVNGRITDLKRILCTLFEAHQSVLSEYFDQWLKHVVSHWLLEHWGSLIMSVFQIKKILCKLSKYDISGSIGIRKYFTHWIFVFPLLLFLGLCFSFMETKWENWELGVVLPFYSNHSGYVSDVFCAGP